MSDLEASRRGLIYGIAAAGAAVPVLAACGSSADDTSDPGAAPSSTGSSPTGGGGFEVAASEIPVGGGAIYPDEQIVVTQPVKGEYKAFSAICTHARCVVTEVTDQEIQCSGCHGSRFSIEDGSVEGGPARAALAAKTVAVDGDTLVIS